MLTEMDRIEPLRLLQEAVHQFHLVKRRLLPSSILGQHSHNLVSQRLHPFVMRTWIKQRTSERHGRSMDRTIPHGKLSLCEAKVYLCLVFPVLEPLQGVFVDSPFPLPPTQLFSNDPPGLVLLLNQFPALRYKELCHRFKEGRPFPHGSRIVYSLDCVGA